MSFSLLLKLFFYLNSKTKNNLKCIWSSAKWSDIVTIQNCIVYMSFGVTDLCISYLMLTLVNEEPWSNYDVFLWLFEIRTLGLTHLGSEASIYKSGACKVK